MQNKLITEIENLLYKDYDHEQPEVLRSQEFGKLYKKLITNIIKPYGWKIAKCNSLYCECSMFIQSEDKFVYLNSGDYRYCTFWKEGILIRTAEDINDYFGGPNNTTNLDGLVDKLKYLFKNNIRMKKVYLCKDCIDLMKQQYGNSLGFIERRLIECVKKEECDMRPTGHYGKLFYQTIDWNNRNATPEEISEGKQKINKKFIAE